MSTSTSDILDFKLDISINANRRRVWDAIVNETGKWWHSGLDELPMDLKLEAWPGGRLFRDLGEGRGHLWGHVQVIKGPDLLEIVGPMFTSSPILHHGAFRLEESGSHTTVHYRHQATGPIPEDLRGAIVEGYERFVLKGLKNYVEI